MYFIPTHAPPPVYDGSPLSEGAFDTKRYPLSFICFLFIGIAFFEPRDYRVVFALQKQKPPIGGFLFFAINLFIFAMVAVF